MMKKFFYLAIMVCLFRFASAQVSQRVNDPSTQANIHDFETPHLYLTLKVDFGKKIIKGRAKWTINNLTKSKTLILDTRNLVIEKVTLDSPEVTTTFSLGTSVKYLGRALSIAVLPTTKTVNVYYATTDSSDGLQWLEPQQTSSKIYPFLYTQSEEIFARTWVPCQDCPAQRFTYSARVEVPKDLMAVMSAINGHSLMPDGIFKFTMPHPIPSYLLALAVGRLGFQQLGQNSGVYAEIPILTQAQKEFADLPKLVSAAQTLCGPYPWGRYDLLVLPGSFPYGGMENPMLTFVTPTIIAGDRSLMSLAAHELAHSWSGNMVTNATWNDFWLNEGFADYLERRIDEAVYGRSFAEMELQLGYEDLVKTVSDMGDTSRDTRLKLDIKGRDPDDVLSDIAYEKGCAFLTLLEQSFGRASWDQFLKNYFMSHPFQSITTEDFLIFLTKYYGTTGSDILGKVNINLWVFGKGIPKNCPKFAASDFVTVNSELQRFLGGVPPKQINTTGWTYQQWVEFLRQLPASLTTPQLSALDSAFHFTNSNNDEILVQWLTISIKHDYKAAYPRLARFLIEVGRVKYITQLYSELVKTPSGKALAVTFYDRARSYYSPIARKAVVNILKV